nr:PREDICTED: uncharacterized protein LOC104145047 isoform X2 [Struthio camelus australis]
MRVSKELSRSHRGLRRSKWNLWKIERILLLHMFNERCSLRGLRCSISTRGSGSWSAVPSPGTQEEGSQASCETWTEKQNLPTGRRKDVTQVSATSSMQLDLSLWVRKELPRRAPAQTKSTFTPTVNIRAVVTLKKVAAVIFSGRAKWGEEQGLRLREPSFF